MPEPGNEMTPFGRRLSNWSLRRNGAALPWAFQSGLQTDLVHAARFGPAGGDLLGARSAAVHQDHVRVLASHVVERGVDPVGVVDGLGAGDGDERSLRQVRPGLLVVSRPEEVAGVDRRGGQLPGAARVRSVPRAPGVAGVGAVPLGGGVAQSLEGVPAIAEVLRTFGDSLQLPGLDFGAVLGILQVLEFRRELVDHPVQPHRLHVQGV